MLFNLLENTKNADLISKFSSALSVETVTTLSLVFLATT